MIISCPFVGLTSLSHIPSNVRPEMQRNLTETPQNRMYFRFLCIFLDFGSLPGRKFKTKNTSVSNSLVIETVAFKLKL